MPNASISLPTAHTMASIDPVSSSTFQGRRDKWYTTHDTSSTRSPFENDVLFGQIHTNTRKHACPTRSSALNELKHTRNTNQVVCVSIFRQETRYTTRAPCYPPPHDPRSRTTNSSTGHTLIDAKRNSTIPTGKRGRRNDELKTRRIYRLGRDVDATTRYRPGTCTDQEEM